MLDAWIPPNPAFPAIHALTLGLLLGAPAHRRPAAPRPPVGRYLITAQPVLLVCAGDGADIFIRALAAERQPAFRVVGILSMRSRQAGRRIQGHPCSSLGTADEFAAVLDKMKEEGRLPALIVLATAHVQGLALERLLDTADRHCIRVRRAPSVTSLDPVGAPVWRRRRRPASGSSSTPWRSRTCSTGRRCRSTARCTARRIQGRLRAGDRRRGDHRRRAARRRRRSGRLLTRLDHGEFAL